MIVDDPRPCPRRLGVVARMNDRELRLAGRRFASREPDRSRAALEKQLMYRALLAQVQLEEAATHDQRSVGLGTEPARDDRQREPLAPNQQLDPALQVGCQLAVPDPYAASTRREVDDLARCEHVAATAADHQPEGPRNGSPFVASHLIVTHSVAHSTVRKRAGRSWEAAGLGVVGTVIFYRPDPVGI